MIEGDLPQKLGRLPDTEQPRVQVVHDSFGYGLLGGRDGFLYHVGQPMLRRVLVLDRGYEELILEIVERLEGAVVLLLADQLVGVVDGVEDLQGLLKGVGDVRDVLADGAGVDQGLLLLRQLFGARLDGLVQLEDLGGQGDGALADVLELVDGAQELLVLGQADPLDVGLAVVGVLRKVLGQGAGAVGDRGIFEDRNQLVKELGVGRRQDDLVDGGAVIVVILRPPWRHAGERLRRKVRVLLRACERWEARFQSRSTASSKTRPNCSTAKRRTVDYL